LNSLSKSHNMAGWRLGMMLGDQNIIQSALKVKSNMDSGMFKCLQLAAVEALNLSNDFHQKRNSIYIKRRKIAEEMAAVLNCQVSTKQGGLFLWMKIPDNYESAELYSESILEKSDVFITPGFIFGKNGEGFLRISLCTKSEQLLVALDRLKKAMEA